MMKKRVIFITIIGICTTVISQAYGSRNHTDIVHITCNGADLINKNNNNIKTDFTVDLKNKTVSRNGYVYKAQIDDNQVIWSDQAERCVINRRSLNTVCDSSQGVFVMQFDCALDEKKKF